MRLYTAHLRAGRPPRLVREGFSLDALILGPLWLVATGAWIPAAIDCALWVGLGLLPHRVLLWAGLAVLQGLLGHDLQRWSLERRGWLLAHVVAGHDSDAAFARLLAAREDLATASLADLRPAGL